MQATEQPDYLLPGHGRPAMECVVLYTYSENDCSSENSGLVETCSYAQDVGYRTARING